MNLVEQLTEELRAFKALVKTLLDDHIDDLEKRKIGYLDYMQMKIKEGDWHGVADCSADLRDIESAIHEFKLFIKNRYDDAATSNRG